mgnify:CR=1 FL=1
MGRAPKRNYRLDILEALLDGPLSKYGIAKKTGLPFPTVLRIVRELEAENCIRRLPGIAARRAHRYELTVRGIIWLYAVGRIDEKKYIKLILSKSRLAPIVSLAPKVVEKTFGVDERRRLILTSFLDVMYVTSYIASTREFAFPDPERVMVELCEVAVLRSFPMWRDELTSEVLEKLSEEEKDKIIEAIYYDIRRFLYAYGQYFSAIASISELAVKIRPEEGAKIEKMFKDFEDALASYIDRLAERKEIPAEVVRHLFKIYSVVKERPV